MATMTSTTESGIRLKRITWAFRYLVVDGFGDGEFGLADGDDGPIDGPGPPPWPAGAEADADADADADGVTVTVTVGVGLTCGFGGSTVSRGSVRGGTTT